jgi:hypothetical protein
VTLIADGDQTIFVWEERNMLGYSSSPMSIESHSSPL